VEALEAGGGAGPDPAAPLVILGFGLGYAAEAAAAQWPERTMVIVERRRAVLLAALERRDLGKLLSGGRLIFVLGESGEPVNPDVITGVLRLIEPGEGEKKREPALLRNPALIRADPEWYAGVEEHIQTWVSKDAVNQATLRRFGKRWVRNLARNMDSIRDLLGISRLAGILSPGCGGGDSVTEGEDREGIPVLLAAAGPSLDRIGPILPALAERCVIVGVDTSLRLLL
jgi:hypothetical protein